MQILSVSVPLVALAVCAGCAMDQPRSTEMGAGAAGTASNERMLYCKDGAYMPKSIGCPAGVERDMTPPASTTK